MKPASIVFAALLLAAPRARAQAPAAAPPASSATPAGQALFAGPLDPHLVAKEFSFTEGPAVDKTGAIFFTDQPNDKIYKYGLDGKLTVFLTPAGRANGLYFDKKGNLIACADGQNQLWSISPAGKVTVLADRVDGRLPNGPNDVWVSPKGGIFFTDPYYKRDYWPATHPAPRPKTCTTWPPAATSRCPSKPPCGSPTASSAAPTAARCTWPTLGPAKPTATTSRPRASWPISSCL